jgi:hypothetical protein
MDWELWRQDDNGNRFLVGRFPSPDRAQSRLKQLTRCRHKQYFWITAVCSGGRSAQAEKETEAP